MRQSYTFRKINANVYKTSTATNTRLKYMSEESLIEAIDVLRKQEDEIRESRQNLEEHLLHLIAERFLEERKGREHAGEAAVSE